MRTQESVQMEVGEKYFPSTSMPERKWWETLWPNPKHVLQTIGITPDMTVVDLCCGDGYFTAPLALLVEGKVYGIDIDPVMLLKAQTEIERTGIDIKQWICGDANELVTMLPEKVDFVLIANTFHGVQHKTDLAHSIASILKSDGRLAIINWHALPRKQSIVLGKPRGPKTSLRMLPEQVRVAVEPAGFDLNQVVEVSPYHYGAVFVLDPYFKRKIL